MFQDAVEIITLYLVKNCGIEHPVIDILPTKDSKMGDYYITCALKYAKVCNKTPHELANNLVTLLKDNTSYTAEVSKNGFINISLSGEYLKNLLTSSLQKIELQNNSNSNKKILIEYSSPNIAKPFTVGHLRTTIIGDSLARIYKELGFTVITDNHLGDYGTQFGKLIWAIKEWGSVEEALSQKEPIKYLVNLYVKFHQEAEKNPDIVGHARQWFLKLENKDPEALKLWNLCVELSLKEFKRIYKELGILEFTTYFGESFYSDKMPEILQELKNKNLLTTDEGAQLVYFKDEKFPPLMIVKKDGASLYATRDLATDKFRLDTYGKDLQMAIVVGSEQTLYFEQLVEVEKMLGFYIKEGQRKHVKNGLFRLKSGKMSTRKGNVLWLSDLISESYKRARELLEERTNLKNLSLLEQEDVLKKVAIGSIKWNDLKREPHKDVIFDWNEVLNMAGNSAPYIQYTNSRCVSLLDKAHFSKLSSSQLSSMNFNEDERQLVLRIAEFTSVVERSANEYSPHYICHYLFEICQMFNAYYAKYKIIGEIEEELRLAIVEKLSKVIQKGLYLLGIEAPKRM